MWSPRRRRTSERCALVYPPPSASCLFFSLRQTVGGAKVLFFSVPSLFLYLLFSVDLFVSCTESGSAFFVVVSQVRRASATRV